VGPLDLTSKHGDFMASSTSSSSTSAAERERMRTKVDMQSQQHIYKDAKSTGREG
jgi:hypothetical protein